MEPRGLVDRARGDGLSGDGTSADDLWELARRDAIVEHLRDLADERLADKAAEIGEEDWKPVERLVLLRTIDSLWVEHLTEIDDMRRGIGLRGYAQQDPLNEFKREAFALYEELRDLIRHDVATSIFRVTVTRQPADPAGGDPPWPPRSPAGGGPHRRQRLERDTDRRAGDRRRSGRGRTAGGDLVAPGRRRLPRAVPRSVAADRSRRPPPDARIAR